jgi:hypothetical protein
MADEPKFDPDFSPGHEHNKETAKKLGLRYEPKKKQYIDRDGCPTRDRFGQPLG